MEPGLAGDLTSNTFDGATPWRDVETPAAQATGPVEVAVAPHHGMFDATGADAVRALRPRVWVILAWRAAHPNMATLERGATSLPPTTTGSAARAVAPKWLKPFTTLAPV